jgi:hypothetical protein
MKAKWIFPTIFLCITAIYFILLSRQQSSETGIVGKWKEVSWEYEKVDTVMDSNFDFNLTDHIKSQVAENLIIHEAEVWQFDPDRTLEMQGEQLSKSVNWKLKGRGNILQIQGEDDAQREFYNIQKLDSKHLVLHFNLDLQVRGIVKITFERIDA